MCWNHYQRRRRGAPVYVFLAELPSGRMHAVRFGPPLPAGWTPPRCSPPIASLEERFWARVNISRKTVAGVSSPCWEWTGQRINGYAAIRLGGRGSRTVRASRVAWEIATGARPPADLFLCHRCDNPGCVNPDHLFLGTHQDNMDDMVAKGRAGGRVARRLSNDQVLAMRRAYADGAREVDLAREVGVGLTAAHKIVVGETYADLPGALPGQGGCARKRRRALLAARA